MLDKLLGNISVKKLWTIFLLKAGFNTLNKIIFNRRVILSLENNKNIPYKIIGSRCSQATIHLALSKKLIADIANQEKYLTIVISADTTNYYDRISYPIAGIAYRLYILSIEYLAILFRTIQAMQMHLHTSFGISNYHYSETKLLPFQGVIQGNKATPVLQLILLILLIQYLYHLQLVLQSITLVLLTTFQIAALLYANDTNIIVRNDGTESKEEILIKAQKMLQTQQYALQITGSNLKLQKYNYAIILLER